MFRVSQLLTKLNYAFEWVEDNCLNLNPDKCDRYVSLLRENFGTNPGLKEAINTNTFLYVESVAYFGVTFLINDKWTAHLQGKRRRLSTPIEVIEQRRRKPYCFVASKGI